ncbi:acyl transferase/acyl hydrolase/lysophospholipase [Neohortaea acidophila]|uniref:Acyl transferase/acyl hydrolase/lysophospholipase n=1 Tax=Neohortaea acidophila TaxID=245834 RepID=A0A6A6Q5U7_9PEZI|nr:acyl transferase/acyl hydrolase/lysophospholipase [Neohortaea acidophila]KAF2487441.1 acyl transferase/acyl hydrolase/lysophospholipase [Neohortaea acidophila]
MDEVTRLKRKDTTKGPPLRILSLDGGGVRGYSMLIILQELMHRTFVEIEGRAPKRHEIPRPCDHFDLIAGTGTGGLIAIMLGRLRLDLDTCKDLYVRMTRRVFETDKTFAGIPLKSTMFKASKLEEVIRECVREHTVSEYEGNDTLANATPMGASARGSMESAAPSMRGPQRTFSQSSKYSQMGGSPASNRLSFGSLALGDPNALLYDSRENRAKTAVTAVMRGTPVTKLLRSYDSRKEPAPEVDCTIWQAGRATSATAMAFKPIQIGQSVYLDEGPGKYNPAPLILDEAVSNEWPGREVGVFVSIGTGKRAADARGKETEWWEGFLGGSMSDFAEARRRLISKLEGCEKTHQDMLHKHLFERGVNPENYCRLNVEVGVGEFGMNEWARLSEISTNTRMYLSTDRVEVINQGAAHKLGKIHFAKLRHDRAEAHGSSTHHDGPRYSWQDPWDKPLPPGAHANAVELPGDDMYYQTQGFRPGAQHYEHRPSTGDQKYVVVPNDQHYAPQTTTPHTSPPPSSSAASSTYESPQYHQRYPSQTRSHLDNVYNAHQDPITARRSHDSPPPIPPKTPVDSTFSQHQQSSPPPHQPAYPPPSSTPADPGPRTFMNMGDLGRRLPYPDVDGPPPAVNTANKPQMSR